jgi:protein-tyrosine phosphatase
MSSPFTLVFVCTANRGRSPVAEAIARRLLPNEVVVRSRGIRAVSGVPALPDVLSAAGQLGLDLSTHRSELLDRESVADASLVVGFEQIHVASAVIDADAPRDKTFTLPQLVGLLPKKPAGSAATAAALIESAAELREQHEVAPSEVLDPVGRPERVVAQIVGEIDALTRRLVWQLFGRR